MTPWSWDLRIVTNPGCALAIDLAAYAAILLGSAALLAVCFRLIPLLGRYAGRGAALLVVTVALFAGLWNWPVADDWCWAAASRQYGLIGVIMDSYLGWTGRFGAYLLECWYGWLIGPVPGSVLWSWLLITGTIWAGWSAVRPFVAGAGRDRLALGLAVGGFAAWAVTMEWPGHGLYWFSATTTYAVAIPGLLLLIAGVGRQVRSGGRGRLVLVGLLAACLGGIAESMAAAMLSLLLPWTVRAWWLRLPSRRPWTVAVIAMAGGLLVNALSPGTASRAAALDATVGSFGGAIRLAPAEMLEQWFAKSLLAAWAWLAHPVMLLCALAAAPLGAHIARRLGWGLRHAHWEIPFAWLSVLGVVLAGYLPSMIALGHAPPWRGRDALQGLVLITGFIALVRTMGALREMGRTWFAGPGILSVFAVGICTLLLADRHWMQTVHLVVLALVAATLGLTLIRHRTMPRPVAGWLLAGALLVGGSFPSLLLDGAVYGPRWRALQGVQAQTLEAGGRPGAIGIVRMSQADAPHHLWYYGPGNDPGHWINRGVAAWYGVDAVVVWPDACE